MFLVHYECTYPSVFYFLSEGKYFKFTFCVCLDHVSLASEIGSQEPRFKFQLKLLLRYGTPGFPQSTHFSSHLGKSSSFLTPWALWEMNRTGLSFFPRWMSYSSFASFCHLLIPPFSIPWPPQHTSSAFSYNVYVQAHISLFPTIVVVRIRALQRNRTIGQ